MLKKKRTISLDSNELILFDVPTVIEDFVIIY